MNHPARFILIRLAALTALAATVSSCGKAPTPAANGKLHVVTGLPPVAYLTRRIGGDRITVDSILPEGRTPHDFTPRTPAIREAARSRLFLTTGQTFESKIAAALSGRTPIRDATAGIRRIPATDGGHDHHDGHEHHDHHDHDCAADGLDPQVWLSCRNAAAMADNIAAALTEIDPAGAELYRRNRDELKAELRRLDEELKRELAPLAGRTFFVYHPAFGYFAADYRLKQRAVELDGREAGAARLAALIREARAAGATTIFVQKQFNPRTARALAEQIGGTVEHLDPLAFDLTDNLRRSAAAIRRGFAAPERRP